MEGLRSDSAGLGMPKATTFSQGRRRVLPSREHLSEPADAEFSRPTTPDVNRDRRIDA